MGREGGGMAKGPQGPPGPPLPCEAVLGNRIQVTRSHKRPRWGWALREQTRRLPPGPPLPTQPPLPLTLRPQCHPRCANPGESLPSVSTPFYPFPPPSAWPNLATLEILGSLGKDAGKAGGPPGGGDCVCTGSEVGTRARLSSPLLREVRPSCGGRHPARVLTV